MAAAVYRDATSAVGSRLKALGVGGRPGPQPVQRSESRPEGRGAGRDPLLSRYVCTTAVGTDQPLGLSNVLHQLTVASQADDKASKASLASALRLLFLFEHLSPEAGASLARLLPAQGEDVRLVKPLSHLAGLYLSGNSAGTPTLFDPATTSKKVDDKVLTVVLDHASALLARPDLDPGLQRALLFLFASAARASAPARKLLLARVQAAIAAADERPTPRGPPDSGEGGAASDWALQHSVFAAVRAGGAATGLDPVSRACFVGLGSPDAVGARHALGLAALVAAREPSAVALEMGGMVAEAAAAYAQDSGGEAGAGARDGSGNLVPGQGSPAAQQASPGGGAGTPPSPINLADPFARLTFARLCAEVVHSDARGADISRDGAPFWNMLCLLATRDKADMVRFGALEALAGGPPTAPAPQQQGQREAGGRRSGDSAHPAPTTLPGSSFARGSSVASRPGAGGREEVVARRRRARAWRLLASQAASPVLIPGLPGSRGAMGLLDAVGALLRLALRKADDAPRRRVALGVVAALAEACLAADAGSAPAAPSGVGSYGQPAPSPRGSSAGAAPATAAAITRVMSALGGEALALLEGPLSGPERAAALQAALLLQAAGLSSGLTPSKILQAGAARGWTPALQGLLNATVLECARARPAEAAAFLARAHAVVGMCPAACEPAALVALWDAAAAATGDRGARAAALMAVQSLLGAAPPPVARAPPGAADAEVAAAAAQAEGWARAQAAAAWWLGERGAELAGLVAGAAPAAPAPNLFAREASAPPSLRAACPRLAAVVASLAAALGAGGWELRCAAARALATLGLRAGEPARAHAYALLCNAAAAPGDALGAASATAPGLAAMDAVYATLAAASRLWVRHGADPARWPADDALALALRAARVRARVEATVCALPAGDAGVLGHAAARLLAEHPATADGAAAELLARREPGVNDGSALGAPSSHPSDTAGSELARAKASEVDAILSGGSEDVSLGLASQFSPVLADKNREVEDLLAGRTAPEASPWGNGASAGAGSDAAVFETFGTTRASGGSPDATPRFGTGTFPPLEPTPEETEAGEGGWAAAGPPAGAPHGPRIATVAHMFIADYSQPDELSVFEGDAVEVLEESEGWALVKDPSGAQGLVPLSYLAFPSAGGANGGAARPDGSFGDAGGVTRRSRSLSRTVSGPGSPGPWGGAGRPARQPSLQSKEDLLGDMFDRAGDQHAAGGTFGGDARAHSFGTPPGGGDEDAALFGGGYSAPLPPEAAPRRAGGGGGSPAQGQRRRFGSGDWGGLLGGGGSARHGGADAGPGPARMLSGVGGLHHRTVSGGSSERGGASTPVSPGGGGGRPGTASEGDRAIVAGFAAEMEGELTVAPGDRVLVHNDADGWARVMRLSDGRSGLVPSWAVAGGA
ncbi:hypothetical protein ACKKBF_B16055 [Auxenochlorella protothecoides x Auxenochlorella symbiontica]